MTLRFRHSTEYRRMTPEQRWHACLDKRPDGCWVWRGVPNKAGYGTLKVNGKSVCAHRFGYELLVGLIPADKQLDHLCRNRRCVNPAHLEPVTCRENVLRGETLAARESRQTMCIYGHPLEGDNLGWRADGKRVCRACNRERARAWRQAQISVGAPPDDRGLPRAWTFGETVSTYVPAIQT